LPQGLAQKQPKNRKQADQPTTRKEKTTYLTSLALDHPQHQEQHRHRAAAQPEHESATAASREESHVVSASWLRWLRQYHRHFVTISFKPFWKLVTFPRPGFKFQAPKPESKSRLYDSGATA